MQKEGLKACQDLGERCASSHFDNDVVRGRLRDERGDGSSLFLTNVPIQASVFSLRISLTLPLFSWLRD